MAELATTASTDQAAPPPPASFEAEVVREFEPSAPKLVEPLPSGPGYAPAEPIKIEWPSDLVQVESDPEKVPTAEPAVEQDPGARPKRVRPSVQATSEEPLVQIETSTPDAVPGGIEPKDKEIALPG